MRPVYFLLKFILGYSLRVVHAKHKKVNVPKTFFTRTIFASNHPSAFLDPLVISVRQYPVIHFMTRADIYKGFIKFVFWNVHMIPIFRGHDGNDSAEKNKEVFDMCYNEVRKGKGLIVFAEGFTDDVFIRRLKPLKKGSVKIGFHICEKMNWKKKIYIQPTGLNYTHPQKFRSSVLISYGKRICLNDYKADYLENPAKVINELTKLIEQGIQDQITHVENKDWAPFHENIMKLTRKGMNNECYDASLSLKKRWEYSKNLASWLNQQDEQNEALLQLKSNLENYFSTLKRNKMQENDVLEFSKKHKISLFKQYVSLIVGFPFLILGFLHAAPVYFWLKPFVEKTFRRDVFWSGVKMVGGIALAGFYNLVFIFLFHAFVYPSWTLALLYYFTVPLFGFLVMRNWFVQKRELARKKVLTNFDFKPIIAERKQLLEEIQNTVPVA